MRDSSFLHRLDAVIAATATERISIGTLLDGFGTRGWGLSLLLFGASGLVPGIAPVFATALCVIAGGMILGQDRPWLPARIRGWDADRRTLAAGMARLRPTVTWIERRLYPRGRAFLSEPMVRLAGLAALINAVLIVLPVPFGNTAPAVATLVLALGLLTHDGYAVMAGLILTVVALLIDAVLAWTSYHALTALLTWLF